MALELVIVFVGLYAAFAVSEYQANRDAAERREQFRLALVREIEDIMRTRPSTRVCRETYVT